MAVIRYIVLVLTVFVALAWAEQCVYHHGYDEEDTYVTCDSGCCYSYIYPCCEDEFVYSNGFKIGLAVSGVVMFIGVVVVIIIVSRRRAERQRMMARNVMVPSTAGGVFVTNTNTNMSYGGNQHYGGFAPAPYPGTMGTSNVGGNPAAGAQQPNNNYFNAAPPAYSTLPPAYQDCQKPSAPTS